MNDQDDKTAGAAVVGNGLVTFMAGFSKSEKRDVKYSIRLARWAADSKYDFGTQLNDWFLHFAATLKFLGWEPSGDAITEIYHPNFYGSVAQAYLTHVISQGSPTQVTVTQSAFDALQADKVALSGFFSESEGVNFQILPLERGPQQRLKLTVNNFRLFSGPVKENFLFFEWEEQVTKLIQHCGRFLLDRTVFEQRREFLERRISEITFSEFELHFLVRVSA
jgi:hypothetical protein